MSQTMNRQNDLSVLLNEIEDYNQTVKAILAFAAFVVHDAVTRRAGAKFGFGRRMETSRENQIQPSTEVTPDLVAQKSPAYGIVAEAKKRLERDTARWERHVDQLRKYDDNLIGWWTEDETIPNSNTVLLIHQSRSRPFVKYLESTKNYDPEAVGARSCVVEFNCSEETATYYNYRLEYGQLDDDELAERLTDGVPVPLDKVLRSFGYVRYYDSEPPLPLLLTNLWSDILPAMAADSQYEDHLKAYRIEASVEKVTSELQRAYGSQILSKDARSVEFPKHSWVRKAFERLVAYKLGNLPPEGSDVFELHYRRFRKDILQRFVELEHDWIASQSKQKKRIIKEESLFPKLDLPL